MVTTPAVAVGLQLGLALVGLLLAGSRSRYTRAGVVLAALALLAPVLVPAEMPLLRGVLSLISWLGFLRAVDLARDERRWPPWRRIWLGVSYFDAREAVRVGARLDGWHLVRTVGFGALAVASYALATWSDGGALARYGGGLVFLYASADGFHAASRLFWRAVGFEIEPFHRDPILSRTVGEFWGRRWNLVVHDWLRHHIFAPLRRRGRPVLGAVAAFMVSAAIHVWFVLIAVGPKLAALMGMFFVVQLGVVLAERRLGVTSWPRPAAHAWTLLTLVASSPLFVEPILVIAG